MKQVFAEDFISSEEYEAEFAGQKKCKISFVVEGKKIIKESDYIGYLQLRGSNDFGDIQIYGRNRHESILGLNTKFSTADNTNIPDIGEEIFVIINSDTGNVVRYGKYEYDSYPEIPVCQGVAKFSPPIDSYSLSGVLFGGFGIIVVCIFGYIIYRKGRKNKTHS